MQCLPTGGRMPRAMRTGRDGTEGSATLCRCSVIGQDKRPHPALEPCYSPGLCPGVYVQELGMLSGLQVLLAEIPQ